MANSVAYIGLEDFNQCKKDFLIVKKYIQNFSGHCMMEEDKLASSKAISAATSPVKDSVKHGSRDLAKKLISRDVQTEKYAGFNSSSSSEKVCTPKHFQKSIWYEIIFFL